MTTCSRLTDMVSKRRLCCAASAGYGRGAARHCRAASLFQELAPGRPERPFSALRAKAIDDDAPAMLDLMLPDGDGLDVCLPHPARLPATAARLPLLMLTARGEPMDRIVGLELGADDYLPKPFEPRELLARMKALLRRRNAARPGADDVLRFGRLEIDLGARRRAWTGRPAT
jgi:DNA-binding response OmpR family regulator